MAYGVKVEINLSNPIGLLGFGMPLILLENADAEVPYTDVYGIEDLEYLGIENTSVAYKAAALLFSQKNAPEHIAMCAVTEPATTALARAELTEKGWRHLIVVTDGETGSSIQEISTIVEGLEHKMYFASLATDDATTITTSNLRRTVLFYCDATEEAPVPVAALVGEIAGRDAGSFTVKNMILAGIPAQDLTDGQVANIHKKGGITYVVKAGDNVVSEGKTAGGEYIDAVDIEDYVVQQISYETQKVMNQHAKIPYDNNGIGLLESVCKNVLHRCYNNGMILTNDDGTPGYWVKYALREETKASDRAARKYIGGKFGFTLAGAIHDVEVVGEITV